MLAALAESRDRQNRLVADAGHELRTPLTSLRTNLDLLAQSDARPPPAARRWTPRAGCTAGGRTGPDRRAGAPDRRCRRARPGGRAGRDLRAAGAVRQSSTEPSSGSGVGRPAVGFDVRMSPWYLAATRAARAGGGQPARQRRHAGAHRGGEVHIRLDRGVLHVADEGPGIPAEDLPQRLRTLLPLHHGARRRRIGARPGDRPTGRGAARRPGRRRSRTRWRRAPHAVAPRLARAAEPAARDNRRAWRRPGGRRSLTLGQGLRRFPAPSGSSQAGTGTLGHGRHDFACPQPGRPPQRAVADPAPRSPPSRWPCRATTPGTTTAAAAERRSSPSRTRRSRTGTRTPPATPVAPGPRMLRPGCPPRTRGCPRAARRSRRRTRPLPRPSADRGRRAGASVVAVALLAGIIGADRCQCGGHRHPAGQRRSRNVLVQCEQQPLQLHRERVGGPDAPSGHGRRGRVRRAAERGLDRRVNGASAGEGSGIVLDTEGHILTNNHVVAEVAERRQADGDLPRRQQLVARRSSAATRDRHRGHQGRATSPASSPPAWAARRAARSATQVVAIGSPLGLAGTVTERHRQRHQPPGRHRRRRATPTHASSPPSRPTRPSTPATPAVPLVDLHGQRHRHQLRDRHRAAARASGGQSGNIGVGFAIPIDQAMRIASQIIGGQKAPTAGSGRRSTATPRG